MGVDDLKEMDEHIKKAPVKKTLLQKLADNRAKQKATKEHYKKIYMEEYNKGRAKAIKKRARQEAFEKHRPTRKQKIDSMLKGFENLGLGAAGVSQPRRKTGGKKKRKQKYVIVGGKAYPKAGSGQSKSQPRRTKKKRSGFDLDLDFVDDIGDFDF